MACLAGLLAVLAVGSAPAAAASRQRLTEGWEYYQGSLGSTWEVWRGDKASDNVTWTPVTLPHCFNARDAVDPDVRYYQGPGWYRTRLKPANAFPGGRLLLHFQGAGQKAEVFVGLAKVGEHVGGYDEWTVDITDAAASALKSADSDGSLPLAVRCDNSRDAEMIPSDLSDFNRYGGLYRHVDLVSVPALSLERVHIAPVVRANGTATVCVNAWLRNPSALADEVQVALRVEDPQGQIVHRVSRKLAPWTGGKEVAAFEVKDAQLWSPRTPALYRCSVTLTTKAGEQLVNERFGFRSFEWVEHGPFKLNGERLLLRGTHYHEDHAGVAAAVPDDVVRDTLAKIKAMGANFVRLGHYQQAPLVLELCDELGLLVWEEIPWCRGGLGGERYQQQCREMLRAMIDQHYNHPAVILWGLGNENDWPGDFETFNTNAIRSFMAELNTLAHQLDPSRPTSIRRCDFCKDVVDVYSPSIWAGWYSGRYTEYKASTEKWMKAVPRFFHAEWGGDSHARRHAEDPEKALAQIATGQGTAEVGKAYKKAGGSFRASKDGDWSETYICNLFDWHLKEQEQIPNLTGSAQWIFKDFATPLRPENPVPRVNQKGVLERDGTPKEGYYVFQSYWAEKPMAHIYGHTWPVRWGQPGEEKLVKVYSNCREVELFVNGQSAGVKQRNSADFPAAGLRWKVPLVEGTNTVRCVGRGANGGAEDTLSFVYQTKPWEKPAKLALREIARSNAVATIEAQVFDQAGVPCLDATNLVRFGLTGDGRLLDNLGTSTGSRAVQLYNGRAQISLQLTGSQAVTSVGSEGLESQFLTVTNGAPSIAPRAANLIGGPAIDVAAIDRDRILKAANAARNLAPITITKHRAKLSDGGPHDFYSNGDYWWPDPSKPNGLPYIQRDGQTNPEIFSQHRLAIRQLRDAVAALGAAYQLTREDRYAAKAAELLRVFFLDPQTRMNPNLQYAQAIPGVSRGRGIGIIDALRLVEIPPAIAALEKSPAFPADTLAGLRQWFRELTDWMVTSQNGKDEANTKNNHAVAYWLQVAVYARFTGDETRLAECRRQFKEVFLPKQMAPDGSFPAELKRTKPYGYSIFQLDNLCTLCQVLSTAQDNLWTFRLADGRGIARAVQYLYPFLAEKSKWPLKPDIQSWDQWPARQPCLLFAGVALGEPRYLALWKTLPADPADAEVQRNIAITQPVLWLEPPKKSSARAETAITVEVDTTHPGAAIPSEFAGLSYEMSLVLPGTNGKHFFSRENTALLQMFRTLGVQSLRVGGNTAERETVPVPRKADIDQLFAFAQAAGVKVIYTLRLKGADPQAAADLARYVVERYGANLACFTLGNEPEKMAKDYAAYRAEFRRFLDVITAPTNVPTARFCGPSTTHKNAAWAGQFARDFGHDPRVVLVTQHEYPARSGTNVASVAVGCEKLLSPNLLKVYETFYEEFVPAALSNGIPYRLEEANSFSNGGAEGVSDAFASALWGLDYLYWWAGHGAAGVNFHTGGYPPGTKPKAPMKYAVFWNEGEGFAAHPLAYALKAFTLGANGRLVPVKITAADQTANLRAYAVLGPDRALLLSLINKEYGPGREPHLVTVDAGRNYSRAEMMALVAPGTADVEAKSGIRLGGSPIGNKGEWNGTWMLLAASTADGRFTVKVDAATVTIVKFRAR